ncbi:hypothetical protein Nizo2776_0904 [Lactiplantibacillus plantarum]|nr:hypothetical protein Nizo2776_0904 [Lactiplantibacillus plantarum]
MLNDNRHQLVFSWHHDSSGRDGSKKGGWERPTKMVFRTQLSCD